MKPHQHSKTPIVLPEYYEVPFLNILRSRHADIRSAYTEEPKNFRASFFSAKGALKQTFEGDAAHHLLKECVDKIEEAIRDILRKHSIFFWLHLYRRIGVSLSDELESNTNANTLGLVRNVVEASIQKHGNVTIDDDVQLFQEVDITEVLGGHFQSSYLELLGKEGFQKYVDQIPKNQWVITKFNADDYLKIYQVEGYAYQYWRCMAKMRSTAKGSHLVIGSNGELLESMSEELGSLIDSYDRRIDKPSVFSSNAGLTVRPNIKSKNSIQPLISCSYNVEGVPAKRLGRILGPINGTYVPNFLPHTIEALEFLEGHKTLASAFSKRYGLPLEHMVALLAVTSQYTAHFAFVQKESWRGFLELTRRAYRIVQPEAVNFEKHLIELATEFLVDGAYDPTDLEKSAKRYLEIFTLSPASQERISLWTYGPRSIFIPHRNAVICDLACYPMLLNNLFFGVRDELGKKGAEFENSAIAYLEGQGHQVLPSRQIESVSDGSRETDIAIRVDTTLVLCDCRTIDRPLDIEIGAPGRLQKRQSFLEEKLEKVLSIEQFVIQNKIGKNYDFSWAKKIISVGVTPFVEWIWKIDEPHWIDAKKDTPRIMSLAELDRWLRSLSNVKPKKKVGHRNRRGKKRKLQRK